MPKNMTAIVANFDKVLGYLKEFPRFSSRYLWAKDKAIEGNPDVIWGLVDDIWHWHFNKISVHDPAMKQSVEMRTSTSQPNIMLGTKPTLRTSSSSKLGPRVGSGPAKMQDYLKNGESTGLRSSSSQPKQQPEPQRTNSTQHLQNKHSFKPLQHPTNRANDIQS